MQLPYKEEPKGRVLVVDDDPDLRRAYERILAVGGYLVHVAKDGQEALNMLETGIDPDVVLTDINMPGMDGMALLQAVRERDLEVPVALVTAAPELTTAMSAVQLGAFQYLPKPVQPSALVDVISRAAAMYRFARLRRQAAQATEGGPPVDGDRALLHEALNDALAGLWMAYQPIVSWGSRRVFAYEALMRTSDTKLPLPGAILRAAEKLSRAEEVGRAVRERVATTVPSVGDEALMFVNLHVKDLLDQTLYEKTSALAPYASRIVLEITERAALDDVPDVRNRVKDLRDRGFRIAIDDLGAGYSGLSSLVQLMPDVVKIDMSLVRDVSKSPVKLKLVQSITSLARDMKALVVAEGVETTEEREALYEAGCDLMQGYLFARPSKPFPAVSW